MRHLFYHCFTIIMVTTPIICKAQTFETRRNQFFIMNTLTGGIISGVGAVIHKKPNQTKGNAFLIGFGKGLVGGSLCFAGKYYTYEIKNQRSYWIGWPCKLIHATGASIIENAALNKPMLSNWAMDYGPFRIDISKNKTKFRVLPFATAGILVHLIQKNKFNTKITLQSGTWHFNSKSDPKQKDGQNIAIINSVSVDKEKNWKSLSFYNNQYNTTAHEIIHTYQQRECLAVNNFYLKNKGKLIYWDIPVFTLPYLVGSIKNERYYSNPYELEAESLSRRNAILWDEKDKSTWPSIKNLPY